uniref:UBA domain-containing protein n=1 Tax=Oryza glumipatula TaxID=40148 RepID=A0A0D9ZB56_9ORYZ
MRPNVITEAGISTRLNQWWGSIPFITSGVILICGAIYLVCLLTGYDSFAEICFLPSVVASRFQVYRFYTSVVFHGSLLHVLFNMLALVPLGTELERIMGSVRLLFLMFLLATTNAIFHLIIAFLAAYNPLYPLHFLVDECSIGFSGVIFSMIVIETSLSGVQTRSFWQAMFRCWATCVASCQDTYGLFNYLLPGPSFYSSIEGLSVLSVCVRRPGFILCTGGTTYGQLPTFSNTSTAPSALINANFLRNISSWIPSRQTTTTQGNTQEQDPRFPGRARTLSSAGTEPTAREASANLHASLLDSTTPSDPLTSSQHPAANTVRADATVAADQVDTFDEELKKLVGMGFEKTQAEVALAAADGDPNVAIEILMSQQGRLRFRLSYRNAFDSGFMLGVFDQKYRPAEQLFCDIREEVGVWREAGLFKIFNG